MSRYDLIGKYIHLIDNRNSGLSITNLVGLTIEKKYISSVANIIGTDLSKYKVIRQGQFACSLMQVSRDGKMPVAMYRGEPAIISPAYPVFEVNDDRKLMPEYLHMYLSRPEFDREAVFRAVGGVRGSLDWNDFLSMKMPIPDIIEQRRIVAEYQVVEQKIENNNRLIKALEDTVQTIYHHIFVENIDKRNLPEGWIISCVGEKCKTILGGTPSRENSEYWGGKIPWINSGEVNELRIIEPTEYITEEGLRHSATKLLPLHSVLLAITGATLGQISINEIVTCANQSVIAIVDNDVVPYEYVYPHVKHKMRDIMRNQTGAAQPHINKNDVDSISLILPPQNRMNDYRNNVSPIYRYITNLCVENQKLRRLQTILISKLS